MSVLMSVQGLTKRFGAKVAVHDLDLTIHLGEILGLLGPNGAGKTTTIKMLCGLLRPDVGRVLYRGNPLHHFADVAHSIGVLMDPVFPGYLNGGQLLSMVARLRGVQEAEAEIARVLAFVDLTGAKEVRVSKYSFGMKTRLGLATALLGKPELLILDEPTVGLDPSGQAAFVEYMKVFRAQGGAVLFSSHRLEEVRKLCDRVSYIQNGELQFVATAFDLAQADEIRLVVVPPLDSPDQMLPFPARQETNETSSMVMVKKPYLSQALTMLICNGHQVIDIHNEQSALWRMVQGKEKS